MRVCLCTTPAFGYVRFTQDYQIETEKKLSRPSERPLGIMGAPLKAPLKLLHASAAMSKDFQGERDVNYPP